MQKDDEQVYPPFPPQYAYLEEWVKEAEKEMERIDQEIANTGPAKGPQLALTPPGTPPVNHNFLRVQRLAELNRQKSQLKSDTLNKTAIETAKADSKLSRKILEQVAFRLDTSNAYGKLNKREMKKQAGNERRLEPTSDHTKDRSYDYMASLHHKGQTFGQPPKESDKANAEKQAPKEEKTSSYSVRFFQSLNYTKELEKASDRQQHLEAHRDNRKDITKEAPEPDIEPE